MSAIVPPASGATYGPRGLKRCIGLAGFMLLMVAGRMLFTSVFAESLPYWDEWDAEGDRLLKPWMQHGLHWSDLFAAHNEHRILWTRLLSLLLFQANERQWDNLVAVYANVLVYAATALLAWCVMAPRQAGKTGWLLPGFLVLSLSWLPFGFTNSLTGFQNQFYLMIGFAVACIGIAARGRGHWSTPVGCVLLAIAGIFSMASGLLAPVVAGAVLTARTMAGDLPRRYALLGVPALVVVALTGVLLLPHVSGHDPLKAGSVGEWFIALRNNLAWPLGQSLTAVSLAWLPSLCAGWALVRSRLARPALFPAFGIAAWVLMQCMAMAYSRGAEAVVGERYLDILALGLVANLCLAIQLCAACRGSGWRRLGIHLCPWLYAAMCTGILCARAPAALQAAAQKQEFARIQTENVRRYIISGDLHDLQQPFMEIPYPDPHRLAALLGDPVLRAMLPASVRVPVQMGPSESSRAFHRGGGYAWSSCGTTDCSGPTGQWRSDQLLPSRSALVVMSAPGRLEDGLSLTMAVPGTGRGVTATASHGPAVFTVDPGQPVELIAEDNSRTGWLTFDTPVEAGRLSASALRLQSAIRDLPGVRFHLRDRRHWQAAGHAGSAGAEPRTIATGDRPLHATVSVERAGWINRLGVRIGTYGGRADGRVRVVVCAEARRCVQGQADLRQAIDNADLMFVFERPLRVSAGQKVSLLLHGSGGRHPFALWTYPDSQSNARLIPTASSTDDRTVSIGLGFTD